MNNMVTKIQNSTREIQRNLNTALQKATNIQEKRKKRKKKNKILN